MGQGGSAHRAQGGILIVVYLVLFYSIYCNSLHGATVYSINYTCHLSAVELLICYGAADNDNSIMRKTYASVLHKNSRKTRRNAACLPVMNTSTQRLRLSFFDVEISYSPTLTFRNSEFRVNYCSLLFLFALLAFSSLKFERLQWPKERIMSTERNWPNKLNDTKVIIN